MCRMQISSAGKPLALRGRAPHVVWANNSGASSPIRLEITEPIDRRSTNVADVGRRSFGSSPMSPMLGTQPRPKIRGRCRLSQSEKIIYMLCVRIDSILARSWGVGKTKTHCGGNFVPCDVARPCKTPATFVARRAYAIIVSEIFQNHFFVCRKQHLCPPQMLREWQNELTFGKHDHVRQSCRHNVSSFCRDLTLS